MKSYHTHEIIPKMKQSLKSFVGIFEATTDPDVEWPHRHKFFSLVWFTHGSGINVIDFDEYQIVPNRIFAVHPKQIHNWNYSIDCKGYFLMVEEYLAQQLKLEFNAPYVDVRDSDTDFIREIFTRMTGSENQETAISYLFSILNHPTGNNCHDDDNSIIIEYKRMVAEDHKLNNTIEQYAERLNVSPDILNDTCKRKTGLTAKQLQLDIKITEAKRLLLYSTLNISEIAFSIGFEDSSYFSRIFKKKTGFAPNSFQEKYLKN